MQKTSPHFCAGPVNGKLRLHCSNCKPFANPDAGGYAVRLLLFLIPQALIRTGVPAHAVLRRRSGLIINTGKQNHLFFSIKTHLLIIDQSNHQ